MEGGVCRADRRQQRHIPYLTLAFLKISVVAEGDFPVKMTDVKWVRNDRFPPAFFLFKRCPLKADQLEGVRALSISLAKSMGYEIICIEELPNQGRHVLRFFLDKPDFGTGVTIDDCARFSRALGPILDVEADVGDRYVLEVSSPGLDRPIVSVADFKKQIGSIITLISCEVLEGRKKFKGELNKVIEESGVVVLEIKESDQILQIPFSAIKKANLDFFSSQEKMNTGNPKVKHKIKNH